MLWFALVLTAACGGSTAARAIDQLSQLEIELTTDLDVPKDVDSISVTIAGRSGPRLFELGPADLPLPATIADIAIRHACSAGARGSCSGFLGGFCASDADCGSGLVCHVDALGRSICTVPCTVTTAGDGCFQALGTGGLPYSGYAELAVPGSHLLCAAGYCTWR